MLTIPQIILRAEISQYLAVNAIQKGGLFGKGIPNHLPELIYQVRKSISRMYNLNPSEQDLVGNANYLYTLCGRFGLQASYLISSGGSIPSPTGTKVYGYPMSASYSALTDGETVIDISSVNIFPSPVPAGSKVFSVFKSVDFLIPQTQYSYVYPLITLLNGIALSPGEELSFSYVSPI